MDTKEQALEKARNQAKEFIDGCWPGDVFPVLEWGDFAVRCVPGDTFPYAPAKPIPPKGTIVECWNANDTNKYLGYSEGKIDDRGWIKARTSSKGACPISWEHWRVVL